MNFDTIFATAEWLGKDVDVLKLNRLKDLTEHQNFYVTVWGHYSSGKSRLINNILGRDILPVQVRETTAVMTYIQYGMKEECVLVYDDGSFDNYDLSVLKFIFQNTDGFEKLSKIDHIEVYVNEEILKSGLILVDTPGVNTTIQKHQELAVDAIEQSGRILYVLGNAPTDVDRQFVKQITECGIKIHFIRTKCDRFVETEENAELSLQKEKEDIISFVGDEAEFIPVSNEPDNPWFRHVEEVRELLREMSLRIKDELQEASEARLSVYAFQYEQDLKEEEHRLTEIMNGNEIKVSEEISVYEEELRKLEALARDIEDKLQKKVIQTRNKSEKELDSLITKQVEKFAKELNSIDVFDEVEQLYSQYLSDTIKKIHNLLNFYFDEIVEQEVDNMLTCISNREEEFPIPTYVEIQQENSRTLELYQSRLNEAKQRIELIMKEKADSENEKLNQEDDYDEVYYQEALRELDQQLAEIPSGMALRVAEKQNIQPSTVFKKVGEAADLLLLLVPGDAIFSGVKALGNSTKIAQGLHKMGKAGEIIVKTGNNVGKNAKAIDRVRDITYTMNTIFSKRNGPTRAEKRRAQELIDSAAKHSAAQFECYKERMQVRKEAKDSGNFGNVFDALSIAYWTEKLGAKFDKPPKMEVDREEEEYRRQLKNDIMEKKQQVLNEMIQKRAERGLFKTKQSELQFREQEEQKNLQQAELEMLQYKEEIEKQAKEKALNHYKNDYKKYFRNVISSSASDISEQYYNSVIQNITMYMAKQNSELMDIIKSKKEQLSTLFDMQKAGNHELKGRLSQCRELLHQLEISIP